MKSLHILLLCYFIVGGEFAFFKQGLSVKGKLLCNNKPANNEIVKLFDLDRNPGDDDDLMDEVLSDQKGLFLVDGSTHEFTTIEGVVRIYTDCNDGIRPCMRMIEVPVPVSYIYHKKATKTFDIGQIDLFYRFEKETRSCDY
uniref:Transthyretin-like family-containing protein n=1 Tax=Rhabditophanes sp. KR3021 TaxID=114890 RepID=A0AC35UFG9_9BILA